MSNLYLLRPLRSWDPAWILASVFGWLISKLSVPATPALIHEHEGRRLFLFECRKTTSSTVLHAGWKSSLPLSEKFVPHPSPKLSVSYAKTEPQSLWNYSTTNVLFERYLNPPHSLRANFYSTSLRIGTRIIHIWKIFSNGESCLGCVLDGGGLTDAVCRWLPLRTRRIRFQRRNSRGNSKHWEDRYVFYCFLGLETNFGQYKSSLIHRILQPFNPSNSTEAVTSFLTDFSTRLVLAISDMVPPPSHKLY